MNVKVDPFPTLLIFSFVLFVTFVVSTFPHFAYLYLRDLRGESHSTAHPEESKLLSRDHSFGLGIVPHGVLYESIPSAQGKQFCLENNKTPGILALGKAGKAVPSMWWYSFWNRGIRVLSLCVLTQNWTWAEQP